MTARNTGATLPFSANRSAAPATITASHAGSELVSRPP
jgi:hypothetical protein